MRFYDTKPMKKCYKCEKPARHHGFCFEHFIEHLEKIGNQDLRDRFMRMVRNVVI